MSAAAESSLPDPSERCSPEVAMLSSRMDARSASSLPSRVQQIMDPMRSLPAGMEMYELDW